jgi:hypothetical protein
MPRNPEAQAALTKLAAYVRKSAENR